MRTFIQSTLFFLLLTSSSILATPVNTVPQEATPPARAQTGKPAHSIIGRTNHYIPNLQNLAKDPEGSSSTRSSKALKGTGGVAKPTGGVAKPTGAGAGTKSNSTRSTKGTGGVAKPTGTGSSSPCPLAVAALASGISANIADQRNEQAAVTSIGNILAASPVDPATFNSAKASLLDFVNKGIAIREENQKIAPAGNAAIPGLATVANAQIEELNLTMSLDATDLTAASATVEKLKADFSGGIMQNMKNLQAATMGCQHLHVREQKRPILVQGPLHLHRSHWFYWDLVLASLPAAVCRELHPLAGGFIAVCALYVHRAYALRRRVKLAWHRGESQCSVFKADIAGVHFLFGFWVTCEFLFLITPFFPSFRRSPLSHNPSQHFMSAYIRTSLLMPSNTGTVGARVPEQKVMRRRWYRSGL
ncbi:ATP binding protein [Rutstroemia sp. NJR-2017a BBW]|nr:ATP binding protein [Rutstroemia sp. NJR-2017a BBW]